MREGYIMLYRKFKKSSYYTDSQYVHLWINLLLEVNHTPKKIKLKGANSFIEIKEGQLLTSRDVLSKQTGINSSKIERILKSFEIEQQIEQQTFTKYRIISIRNWNEYQKVNSRMDNNCTTSEQQVNTNNNVKNEKNKKHTSSGDEENVEIWFSKKGRKLSGKRLDTFKLFWEAFAYKEGRAPAIDAWLDIPQLTNQLVEQIVKAASATAEKREKIKAAGRTPKMAQGWLAERRWEDQTDVEDWRVNV